MSKRRKNFHYHFAEQYETREERREQIRRKRHFEVSPIALVISLAALVLFGMISISFSVYVTNSFDDPNMPEFGGVIVSVRNHAQYADSGSTGVFRKSDADLASTGATDRDVYFSPDDSWDLSTYPVLAIRYNKKGNDNWWATSAAATLQTDTYGNKTINGRDVYKATVSDEYGGLGSIILKAYKTEADRANDTNFKEVSIFGPQVWKEYSTFTNKYWDPDGEEWVDPDYDAPTYAVTVSSVTAGSGSMDKAKYEEDETATLTVTPDFGYELTSVTAVDASNNAISVTISGNSATFTMPASAVTLSATCSSITTTQTFYVCNSDAWDNIWYHIYTGTNAQASWPGTRITSASIGTITGTGYTEKPVYAVTVPSYFTHIILSNADTGGNNISKRYAGDSSVALTDGTLYFTTNSNSESNPSRIANFNPATDLDKPKYTVTIGSITGGTVTASTDETVAGDTVTLTNTPEIGYEFTSYTVTKDGGGTVIVSDGAFTMPADNVTVTATFTPVPAITAFTVGGSSSVTLNIGGTAALSTTTVHATSGYAVTYTTEDDEISISSSTVTAVSPVAGATVTASLVRDADSEVMDTQEVTVSVNTPVINSVSLSADTLKIADIATLSATTTNEGTGTVSYSVTSHTPASGTGDVVSLSGTTVTALRPGTAVITASLPYATSKTITVTVRAPALGFTSCSVEELRYGTLSVDSGSSITSPAPTNYAWAVKDTQLDSDIGTITLGSSGTTSVDTGSTASVRVNSLLANSEDSSAKVVLTATYSTGYSTTFEATVTISDSPIKIKGTMNSWTDEKMLYDSTTGLYKKTMWLGASTTYSFGIDEGTTYYSNASTTITKDNYTSYQPGTSGLTFTTVTSGNDCKLTTDTEGNYTFYYNPGTDNHKFYIDGYPPVAYYLLGLGSSNWTKDDSKKMTLSSGTTYTYTKQFSAGDTFEQGTNDGFMVWCNKGKYYGDSNETETTIDIDDYGTDIKLSQSGGTEKKLGLNAPYAGDYTFTFNSSTLILNVSRPSRSLSVSAYMVEDGTETDLLETVSLSGSDSSDLYTLTDNHNDTFDITLEDHDQYEFVGWDDDSTYTAPTHVSGNVYRITLSSSDTSALVRAEWQYKGYSIEYYTKGGTLSGYTWDSTNNCYTGTYRHNTGIDPLPTPTFTESGYTYTFAGWYAPDIDGSVDYDGTAVTSIAASATGDKQFYAKWTVRVEFRDNIRTTDQDAYANRIVTRDVMRNSTVDALTQAERSETDTALNALGFSFSNEYSVALDSTIINAAWISSNGSNVIYAIYKPDVQNNFTVVITPSSDGRVTGTGTQQDNYIIKFGATISVHAEVVKPASVSDSIRYKWQAMVKKDASDASYTLVDQDYGTPTAPADGKYTFERADIVPLLTHKAFAGEYKLLARAYYIDARGTEVYTADEHSYSIYYKIDAPDFTVSANQQVLQKIYTAMNSPALTYNIEANDSITDTPGYVNTITNYYKSALFTYQNVYNEANRYPKTEELAITGDGPDFASTYNGVPMGVNYFKFRLMRLVDVEDTTSGLTYDESSATDKIRTVVGTNQQSASRPLYIANNSGNPVSGKRVMLFYITSSNTLGYATGTAFSHTGEGEAYRFDIPADLNKVSIGIFDASKEYALPELSEGAISYYRASSGEDQGFTTNYYAYSGWIDITSSTQKVNISGGLSEGNQIPAANISTSSLLS